LIQQLHMDTYNNNKEKFVLVTGASKGIGRAIVIDLALNGYNVAFNSRNEPSGIELLNDLTKHYPKQKFFYKSCDVSSQTQIQDFCKEMNYQFSNKIDILINNAGQYIPGQTIDKNLEAIKNQLQVNLMSAIAFTNQLSNDMITQKKGHIINMCSVASIVPLPNSGVYCISKFALLGYTKVLRQELLDKNVKVTAVLPGATWSESWNGVDLPKPRLMDALDIAKTITSLLNLSDSATVEELIIRPQLGDL
jgi:short-subunit dehydrogenase